MDEHALQSLKNMEHSLEELHSIANLMEHVAESTQRTAKMLEQMAEIYNEMLGKRNQSA